MTAEGEERRLVKHETLRAVTWDDPWALKDTTPAYLAIRNYI